MTTPDPALHTFEERLLAATLSIVREQSAAGVAVSRPRRRRRRAGLVMAGVGLAAVASAVVAFVPSGDGPVGGGGVAQLAPAPASAAVVVRHATAALAAAQDTIIHAVEVTHGTLDGDPHDYRSEMWFDESDPSALRTRETDEQGDVVLDTAMRVRAGRYETRQIDLAAGTYTDTSEPAPSGPRSAKGDGQAARLRDALHDGQLRIDGRASVDGRAALVLRDDEPEMNRRIWVDAHSFLPIRMVENRAQITYEWLPRTAATTALLWPEPPAGARRLAPSRD